MPSLNAASFFYNIVNQNGTQAAWPEPLHRAGAAYSNGLVLISTPRNFLDNNYSLEFETNTILTAIDGNGATTPTLIPQGNTTPLHSNVAGRLLSGVQLLNNTPYVIWAETSFLGSGVGITSFWYCQPQLDGNNVTAAPITNLTFNGMPTDAILDFATASIGGTIFLFWVDQSAPATIWWAQFDGTTASGVEALFTIVPTTSTIISIDASPVQIDTAGGQTTSIAVVAMVNVNGAVMFFGALCDSSAGPQTQLEMPSVPTMADFLHSCIRVGSATANSLYIVCVPAGVDQSFNSGTPFNASAAGFGPTQMALITLSQPGSTSNWLEVDAAASNWPLQPGFTGGAVQSASSAPMTVLFPIALGSGAQTTNYLGLATSAGVEQTAGGEGEVPSYYISQFFYVQFYSQTS